ncbi:hypothetical protein GGX14DRAFT_395657 [Mycena pura]|uniref:Uncharacterized protein n=1 Tax=Mycena pura TaxID=153505 RepID=A0AAD6VCT8_9AGAR|nr:hypothetical protein GGX14DRAFT_395657 [Mycena pura]
MSSELLPLNVNAECGKLRAISALSDDDVVRQTFCSAPRLATSPIAKLVAILVGGDEGTGGLEQLPHLSSHFARASAKDPSIRRATTATVLSLTTGASPKIPWGWRNHFFSRLKTTSTRSHGTVDHEPTLLLPLLLSPFPMRSEQRSTLPLISSLHDRVHSQSAEPPLEEYDYSTLGRSNIRTPLRCHRQEQLAAWAGGMAEDTPGCAAGLAFREPNKEVGEFGVGG